MRSLLFPLALCLSLSVAGCSQPEEQSEAPAEADPMAAPAEAAPAADPAAAPATDPAATDPAAAPATDPATTPPAEPVPETPPAEDDGN